MALNDDNFSGEGIFSISSSEGFNTLGSVVDIRLAGKPVGKDTIDGDPFRFFQNQSLKVKILDTGQDIIDILENSIGSKNEYYILGSPSVIFKNSRFDYRLDREWEFDSEFHSITLETATDTFANVTGSIRNLLGRSGSCTDSVAGLTTGISRTGVAGSTTSVLTGSNFLLTSSVGNGQRLQHTASAATASYAYRKEMPCKGDIALAFEFDILAVATASGFNTFIELYDVDDNLIISASHNTALASGSQARIELRAYWRNLETQVRYLNCGFEASGAFDTFMDNFQLEYGLATPFVPR